MEAAATTRGEEEVAKTAGGAVVVAMPWPVTVAVHRLWRAGLQGEQEEGEQGTTHGRGRARAFWGGEEVGQMNLDRSLQTYDRTGLHPVDPDRALAIPTQDRRT